MLEFFQFDRRRYPTLSVREGYREWLPSYETTVEDEMDLVLLAALEWVPWTAVERAADLGCGTGRTGAWLRTRGVARIDGIDLTPEMLAIARGRGIYERLDRADVAATGLDDGAYDLITTCLVDEHLRDLQPLYREVARATPTGRRPRSHRLSPAVHHDRRNADSLRSWPWRAGGNRDLRPPPERSRGRGARDGTLAHRDARAPRRRPLDRPQAAVGAISKPPRELRDGVAQGMITTATEAWREQGSRDFFMPRARLTCRWQSGRIGRW